MTEIACATTSCSSRAIRRRSSATAARARSSWSRSSSAVRSVSDRSLWRRSRIVSPASHGPPTISDPKTMSPHWNGSPSSITNAAIASGIRHVAARACRPRALAPNEYSADTKTITKINGVVVELGRQLDDRHRRRAS